MVGNSGRYSKFQQRLKNIRLMLFRKRKLSRKNINDDNKGIGTNNIELFQNINNCNVKYDHIIVENKCSNKLEVNNSRVKVNTNVFNKKKNSCGHVKKVNRVSVKSLNNVEKEQNYNTKDISNVKVEIIRGLKNKFVEKVALIEVMESELFFISDNLNNSLEYKQVRELRKKIEDIIKKINAIIEQYNLYNKYDMDIIVDLDDNCLMDKIINYRDLLDSYDDGKNFVKEYKLLNEFSGLYLKLENIKNDVDNVCNDSLNVMNNYEDRDKKYEQITLEMLKFNEFDKDCMGEIERQNEYLDNLMKKLDDIDSERFVSERLVGLDLLFSQGLKFLSLKLLSPLSGFIPSIVSETLVAKNMVKSAYKNLHFERKEEIHYSAVDYEYELNNRFFDVNSVSNLIDDTIKDLGKMKSEFLLIYNSNILGYEDTFKKIEKLEEILYRNKIKVDVIKKRINVSKRVNENKMIRVKKLNEDRS